MSKAEILEELPKLTPEERDEIRAKLDEVDRRAEDEWLDEEDPLTEEQKRLIEARIAAHERDPSRAISWEEFDARLKRRLGD